MFVATEEPCVVSRPQIYFSLFFDVHVHFSLVEMESSKQKLNSLGIYLRIGELCRISTARVELWYTVVRFKVKKLTGV